MPPTADVDERARMAIHEVERPSPQGGRVALLALDPELADAVPSANRELARLALTAPVVSFEPGKLPVIEPPPQDCLGALILEGLLIRSVDVSGGGCIEFLSAGDLIRPWVDDVDDELVSLDSHWEVTEAARLAVLDRLFIQRAARWPEVLATLYGRGIDRARRLAANSAISHVRRVDARLLTLFWRLAGRWGRVTPEGIVVPLRLTHHTLGCLVGAQRPSVTTALGKLVRQGEVSRTREGYWILHGTPPDRVD